MAREQIQPARDLDDHIEMGELFEEHAVPGSDGGEDSGQMELSVVDFTVHDLRGDNEMFLRLYLSRDGEGCLKYTTTYHRYEGDEFVDWLRDRSNGTRELSEVLGERVAVESGSRDCIGM